MREFFKGWRRKVGCLTLAVACAMMAGWIRSIRLTEGFKYPKDGSTCHIESSGGEIKWSKVGSPQGVTMLFKHRLSPKTGWYSSPIQARKPDPMLLGVGEHREWGGFRFRAYVIDEVFFDIPIEEWAVPYWALVLPPTLLSACLMLWKPWKRVKADA
jgi:hypothetical protein